MKRVCYMCNKLLGYKPGKGITHGICDDCLAKAIQELEDKKRSVKYEHTTHTVRA